MQMIGVAHSAFLDFAKRLQRWAASDYASARFLRHHPATIPFALVHRRSDEVREVHPFQRLTDKRLPGYGQDVPSIAFPYRKNIGDAIRGVQDRLIDTRHFRISSLESTALDLLRYSRASGGTDHVAAILTDSDAGSTSASSRHGRTRSRVRLV